MIRRALLAVGEGDRTDRQEPKNEDLAVHAIDAGCCANQVRILLVHIELTDILVNASGGARSISDRDEESQRPTFPVVI